MTLMKIIIIIIKIEKGEAYHFSSEVHFITEYTDNLEGEHCFGFSLIF